MREMGIGVSKHLLDETFSILWGNPEFYQLLGYTEEEFKSRFSDLRQYYAAYRDDFDNMRNYFLDIYSHGEKSGEFKTPIPVKLSSPVWVKMAASFIKSQEDESAVVYIFYTNINEWMLEEIEHRRVNKELTDRFIWMLSEYGGNVYVCDIDTYELLYLNKHSCDTLQKPLGQLTGRKCYEAIQGRTSPCPFCTNSLIRKDDTYEWKFYNTNLKRTFILKDRLIDWEGHRARIELSYDMYSAEYKLAKKDQEREAILRTIPAGMARIDARDRRTVLWYNDTFLRMIGYTRKQFEKELNSQCTYLHPDDFKRVYGMLSDMKCSGENMVFEVRAYTRSREERIWTVTLCYISGEDSWDGIDSYYSVGLDITEERRQIETLRYKAAKDSLTGIYNRAETER